jgi:very-short-patch-repair endonuclease
MPRSLKHRRLTGTRIDERELRGIARDLVQWAGVPKLRLDPGMVEVLLHSPAFKMFGELERMAEVYIVRWHRMTDLGVRMLAGLLQHWVNAAAWCESPIEKLLLWAMLGQNLVETAERGNTEVWPNLLANRAYLLVQQAVPGFIADFVGAPVQARPCVIECDGHDFHSHRQQQARDRKRDRDLQLAGYTILRFTGSQIVTDPNACAAEVARHWGRDA